VKVESAGPTTVQTNEFDGLNRRIVREQTSTGNPKLPERKCGSLLRSNSGASDTYDYFYNEAWQLLEERKDGDADPLNQFVWNADYIDSLALRYYDSDTDANLAEGSDGEFYCKSIHNRLRRGTGTNYSEYSARPSRRWCPASPRHGWSSTRRLRKRF
jgi:hypothetical protein